MKALGERRKIGWLIGALMGGVGVSWPLLAHAFKCEPPTWRLRVLDVEVYDVVEGVEVPASQDRHDEAREWWEDEVETIEQPTEDVIRLVDDLGFDRFEFWSVE